MTTPLTGVVLAVLFLVLFAVVFLLNRTAAAEVVTALAFTTVFVVGLRVFSII